MPSYRTHKTESMNMTPMIDVVFLLIIFFLVSTNLAQQETQLELDLPQATTADNATDTTKERVTINLMSDGTLLLGASPASIDKLAERLKYEQAKAQVPLEIRIRADRSIEFGHVKPVLLACAEAKVWDVTFAVLEPAGGSP